MEERIQVLTHLGEKLLHANLSGLSEDEIIVIHEKIKAIAIRDKIYLHILDVSNTNTTQRVKEVAATTMKEIISKIGPIYSSLIGLRLAQQIIANMINRDQYFASNLEDAKDWLVKKYKKESRK
jgi:hypothetical protein